jgi:hypothetical protein
MDELVESVRETGNDPRGDHEIGPDEEGATGGGEGGECLGGEQAGKGPDAGECDEEAADADHKEGGALHVVTGASLRRPAASEAELHRSLDQDGGDEKRGGYASKVISGINALRDGEDEASNEDEGSEADEHRKGAVACAGEGELRDGVARVRWHGGTSNRG